MIVPRRSFLQNLATLPLIGGGVALIGQPTAVAEPVTEGLLYAYTAFLAHEHEAAYFALERATHGRRITPEWHKAPMFWFPEHAAAEGVVTRSSPATRAALVLSAVGCTWREDDR